jgi:hypothetical protein
VERIVTIIPKLCASFVLLSGCGYSGSDAALSGPGAAQAQNLPSTQQFNSALTTCATTSDISISADLLGSVSSVYDGQKTQGTANLKTATKFIELFPEGDRAKIYDLYMKCIAQILHPSPISSPDVCGMAPVSNTPKTEVWQLLRELVRKANIGGKVIVSPDAIMHFYSDEGKISFQMNTFIMECRLVERDDSLSPSEKRKEIISYYNQIFYAGSASPPGLQPNQVRPNGLMTNGILPATGEQG